MNQKQKLDHYITKAEQYRDSFFKLQQECDNLKSTLRTISCGAHNSSAPVGWDNLSKIQWTACSALKDSKTIDLSVYGAFYV
jgi:hypothetical protein